ncbi:hypothetical protein D3C76_1223450 [compost metagenome]
MCTFESIQGNAVRFDSAVSGFPKLCRSKHPRLYNNPQAERLNPAYLFGANNNACRAEGISHYNSLKTLARFTGGFNSSIDLQQAATTPAQLVSTGQIQFVGGSEHYVTGYTMGAGTNRQQFFLSSSTQGGVTLPEGTMLNGSASWSTLRMGTGGQFRLRDAGDVDKLTFSSGQFNFLAPVVAGLTGSSAWNGANPFRLGAHQFWVDSSGRLRTKNGAPSSDTDGTIVGTQS